MKTQMEYPLIGLVVLVILVILWNLWSGMQVDLAVASLNATIAGTAAPEPVLIAGQWVVKAIVGTLLGGAVTAGATALWIWARKQLRLQNAEQRQWKSGPNANWGQQRPPKVLSETELYRLMLMQQMAGNPVKPSQNIRLTTESDDEPTITF
jgi:hypothetical protein